MKKRSLVVLLALLLIGSVLLGAGCESECDPPCDSDQFCKCEGPLPILIKCTCWPNLPGCDDDNPCTDDMMQDGECEHMPVECPEGQVCSSDTGECVVEECSDATTDPRCTLEDVGTPCSGSKQITFSDGSTVTKQAEGKCVVDSGSTGTPCICKLDHCGDTTSHGQICSGPNIVTKQMLSNCRPYYRQDTNCADPKNGCAGCADAACSSDACSAMDPCQKCENKQCVDDESLFSCKGDTALCTATSNKEACNALSGEPNNCYWDC